MPDVVIAGAGVVGCATAVHLLAASPGLVDADLHRMGCQRILDNRPYPERGIR